MEEKLQQRAGSQSVCTEPGDWLQLKSLPKYSSSLAHPVTPKTFLLQAVAVNHAAAIMTVAHLPILSKQDCTAKFNIIPAVTPLIPEQV